MNGLSTRYNVLSCFTSNRENGGKSFHPKLCQQKVFRKCLLWGGFSLFWLVMAAAAIRFDLRHKKKLEPELIGRDVSPNHKGHSESERLFAAVDERWLQRPDPDWRELFYISWNGQAYFDAKIARLLWTWIGFELMTSRSITVYVTTTTKQFSLKRGDDKNS